MLAGMTTTQQHLLEWVYAHPLHIGVRDPARRARARFIQQPVEALAEKSRAPLADGLLGQSQFARDDGVRLAGAHSSTNRARSARARAVVGRRAQRSSVSRSSSVRVSGGMGRPVRMGVPPSIGGTLGVRNLFHLFTTQGTRSPMHITNDKMRRPLKTIIFGLGLAASLLAQIAVAQPALLVDTGAGSGVPGIPLFGTGSTTCSPQPGCASNFQYLAGQFTLANGATLDSVQGWMSVAGAMSMVVRIYADNSGVPGTSIFSKTYTLDFSPTAWVIFAGFNPVLAAGT